VKVLIADDHPIFCAGLRTLLEGECGLEVVGEARDGLDAIELATTLRPDLALLDLVMPKMQGLDVLRELVRRLPGSRFIVLTASISRRQIVEALERGAYGAVLKDAASELLLRAIGAVMAGQYWIGRESVTDLVLYMRDLATRQTERQRFRLTPREREVIGAVVDGLTNRDIARRFSVSEDTVKHHLSNVYDKLGVSNRLELALAALDHELVERDQAV
jgi:DNA-binding NarL/FixJ family response regulator